TRPPRGPHSRSHGGAPPLVERPLARPARGARAALARRHARPHDRRARGRRGRERRRREPGRGGPAAASRRRRQGLPRERRRRRGLGGRHLRAAAARGGRAGRPERNGAAMSALSLAHPIVFAALLALVAAAHLLGARRRGGAVAWHPFPRWLGGLPIGARQRVACWLERARLLLLAGLALGIAGPRTRFEERRETRRGVDLFVLLDASSSMTVTLPGSYATTRFAAARESAHAFVDGRPADRVGLATFARWPRP